MDLVFYIGVSDKVKKFTLLIPVVHTLILWLLSNFFSQKGSCLYKDTEYKINSTWQFDCNNCTCIESVPVCELIKCKYEPCEEGKLLVLNDNSCCPVCEEPKKSCHYDEYLIQVQNFRF
jgi:hypothetical protein